MGNKKSTPLSNSAIRSSQLRRSEVCHSPPAFSEGNPTANVIFLREMNSTQAGDLADLLIEENMCHNYGDAQSLINLWGQGDRISSRRMRTVVRRIRSPRKKRAYETLPKDQLTPKQLAKRKALKKRKLRHLRKELGDEEYKRRVREHNTWIRREKALNSQKNRSPSN